MDFILIAVCFVIIIFVIYALALRGNTENPNTDRFVKARYAHRGLHSKPDRPENSLAAFSVAVQKGYGIELDVHLMADGKLAVIHDSSLLRTASTDVRIEELTEGELENYRLENTAEKIPTLKEVLSLVDGKVPLLIELKAYKNIKELCSALVEELEGYKGDFCIESFDPRCVLWFKKNKPDIVRGQLSEDFLKDKNAGISFFTRILLTTLIFNFVNKPDFIAYKFEDRKSLANVICLKLWKMKGFSWTITDINDFATAEKENLAPIFEGFEP